MAKTLQEWTVLPHSPLTQIGSNVLTVTGDIRMPIGAFPRRMTVVRLAGGRSAIWSASGGPVPGIVVEFRTTYVGRFSFMLPRPYASHEPSEGFPGFMFPVFTKRIAGS